MELFVEKDSVVREIWGKADTILFIFAGAAAEFALNKAVDWLYFTGKLPADPLGRLFSTVAYARQIVFSEANAAYMAIDKITAIHASVEKNRQASIPDWAYRDVLFMLIYYSVAYFELLERKLNEQEKEEVFTVFYRVGARMGLKELPANYTAWTKMHNNHLQKDLEKSPYTIDLFKQYKKHLGSFRYKILIESQKLVIPKTVKDLLRFRGYPWLYRILPVYQFMKKIKCEPLIKSILLPSKYKTQVKEFDVKPS